MNLYLKLHLDIDAAGLAREILAREMFSIACRFDFNYFETLGNPVEGVRDVLPQDEYRSTVIRGAGPCLSLRSILVMRNESR
jgi:hypothetical protein